MAGQAVARENVAIRQRPAKTSLAIVICTAAYFVLTLGWFVASMFVSWIWIAGVASLLVGGACYLLMPVEYELSNDMLTVFTHVGRRQFGRVVGCSRVDRSVYFGLRLFGAGGVFGGLGFYWTPRYGLFRAYVTSARIQDMVMVETERQKILISPERPEGFLAGSGGS